MLLITGHLTGLLPEAAEQLLLAAFVGTSLLFAARKYTQPIKDDIGDKSVFMCAHFVLLLRLSDLQCKASSRLSAPD